MRRLRVIALIALATPPGVATLCARPRLVHADERPMRTVGIHRVHEAGGRPGPGSAPAASGGDWLGLSVSVRDLFWPKDIGRLRSGFVVRVVIRVDLVRERDGQLVASQAHHSEILFDLWDERFRVRVAERGVLTERHFPTPEAAIEAATALVRFRVAEQAVVDPNVVYKFRVRADLNPLSEELVADVRRWMKAQGQGRTGTGDSVFGSFVSFFVNPRIDESERQISFSSQPFRGGGP
jgi:hypothetical protein